MNPILFDLGFIQVRYYGLMYAIALFLGLYLAKRNLKEMKVKYSVAHFENIIIIGFLLGIVGGRFYYVLFNLDYYFSSQVAWYEFLAVWHGGLAIHGGILGSLFGAWLATKKFKIPLLLITDLAVPYILLGQALGRIGNFMNGDAHGIPTDLPWGIVFRYGPAASEFPNQALHPVMLYELGLNLLGVILLLGLRKKNFRSGFITAVYFILYGLIRSIVTVFRADDLYLGDLRAPHFFALVSTILVLLWIYWQKLYKRDNPIYKQKNIIS